ncbi:hypothetical protein SAHL_15915 [Salinisphaera orenii YIM 95161]|uniref:Uncharacterized protein n=1 Tax=Salinisphaera orenii YIM 95161 TaxID=1051139 RepID=A0A423PF12_9GAMM|nr:hypothetical protein SAHL_15915 [Salinisphaera halophila YIM 95161]
MRVDELHKLFERRLQRIISFSAVRQSFEQLGGHGTGVMDANVVACGGCIGFVANEPKQFGEPWHFAQSRDLRVETGRLALKDRVWVGGNIPHQLAR